MVKKVLLAVATDWLIELTVSYKSRQNSPVGGSHTSFVAPTGATKLPFQNATVILFVSMALFLVDHGQILKYLKMSFSPYYLPKKR